MNKVILKILLLMFIFSSCEKEYNNDSNSNSNNSSATIGCGDACNEWERCTNVSQDFFGVNMRCRAKLKLYTDHGNWNGQLNIIDELGNTHLLELDNLDANTEGLQDIKLDYPFNSLTYYFENGVFPDSDEYFLSFNFIDSKTLEFTIDDLVYDPFVESVVFYSGTGQIIHTGGSASSILEFHCSYVFGGNSYSVSYSATRN
tara:strand:+ start:87 stop:692 length:606 start_codon:yes stop_codon:yes gene_type:complete